MPNVLITGSNRGLGLEWVRQYAQAGWRVFATCRYPSDAHALHTLIAGHSHISLHRLDVTSVDDLRAIGSELNGQPIDVLLNNAGVYLESGAGELGCIRYSDWHRTLDINTMGAVRVTEALLENVTRSQKRLVVAISSHMGSIADIGYSGSYYYRTSKAALNAVMRGLSWELRRRRVGVLILHPGGVRTRMGPSEGLTTEQSVRAMRQRIDAFTQADSGRFFRFDGVELPW